MAVDFKNKAGYEKWLAYGHMHGVFHGKQQVKIGGKKHKVDHSKHYSKEAIAEARKRA